MIINHCSTGKKYEGLIEPVNQQDYKSITKGKYYFDWKTEKGFDFYKLRLLKDNIILGLVSFERYDSEQRIEIRLLALSKENRKEKTKVYDGIAGALIAYVCREAIKNYGEWGCVSLFPKTILRKHYIQHYGMLEGGKQLYLEGQPLLELLMRYG